MSSSTSSFRKSIVVKTLAAVALTLGIFHIVLSTNRIAKSFGDCTFKENLIRAEEYSLTKRSNLNIVLAGSSILDRVARLGGKRPWFNLCLASHNCLDGVRVIDKSKLYPRVLVLELSYNIRKGERFDLESNLSDSRLTLMKLTPLARTCYQPTGLIYQNFLSWALKKGNGIFHLDTPPNFNWEGALNIQRRVRSQNPDAKTCEQISINLQELKKATNRIEKSGGTKIVLVRVPVDRKIDSSKGENFYCRWFEKFYPTDEYPHIVGSQNHEWSSWDGIHLRRDDAILFKREMIEQLEQITR